MKSVEPQNLHFVPDLLPLRNLSTHEAIAYFRTSV